ncbi:Helitron helicase [Phytophthora megakarya]|uniref:ATP-dependent DNA helicase n=1 Tax=Phytophthora megakarya TaxID=4795 RepID=A0A225UU15_9STRA|nr:Helitron helicase [Phytophthora megakarya]
MSEDKYTAYRRPRHPRRFFSHKGKVWNNATVNQGVVPYNPFLSQKYNCHVNVEICATNKAIKYIYKYVYKGSDMTTITIDGAEMAPNEIRQYLLVRYIPPVEACNRIFMHPIQGSTHSVVNMHNSPGGYEHGGISWFDFYIPALQHHPQRKPINTERIFMLCARHPDANESLLWDNKKWKSYKKYVPSIGRIVQVSPHDPDRFYLRHLLCRRRSPKAYEDLRREEFKAQTSEDFARNIEEKDAVENTHREDVVQVRMAEYKTLKYVAHCLASNGKTLDVCGLPFLNTYSDVSAKIDGPAMESIVQQELNAYCLTDVKHVTELVGQFNRNQRDVFDQVVRTVEHTVGEEKLYFLDGPGGTGKSILLEPILAHVRSQRKNAIAVASSDIGAYRTFDVLHPSQTNRAFHMQSSWQRQKREHIQNTSLIIWGEAPAVDRVVGDIMKNESELSDEKKIYVKCILLKICAYEPPQILGVLPIWPNSQHLTRSDLEFLMETGICMELGIM